MLLMLMLLMLLLLMLMLLLLIVLLLLLLLIRLLLLLLIRLLMLLLLLVLLLRALLLHTCWYSCCSSRLHCSTASRDAHLHNWQLPRRERRNVSSVSQGLQVLELRRRKGVGRRCRGLGGGIGRVNVGAGCAADGLLILRSRACTASACRRLLLMLRSGGRWRWRGIAGDCVLVHGGFKCSAGGDTREPVRSA